MNLKQMAAAGAGGDGELFVAVVQIVLCEVETWHFQHLVADCRCRAIAPDHNLSLDRVLHAVILVLQLKIAGPQIDSNTAMLKEYLHPASLRGIHQSNVEFGS